MHTTFHSSTGFITRGTWQYRIHYKKMARHPLIDLEVPKSLYLRVWFMERWTHSWVGMMSLPPTHGMT